MPATANTLPFTDSNVEHDTLLIPSTWRKHKAMVEGQSQTDSINVQDSASQSISKHDQKVSVSSSLKNFTREELAILTFGIMTNTDANGFNTR